MPETIISQFAIYEATAILANSSQVLSITIFVPEHFLQVVVESA